MADEHVQVVVSGRTAACMVSRSSRRRSGGQRVQNLSLHPDTQGNTHWIDWPPAYSAAVRSGPDANPIAKHMSARAKTEPSE